MNLRRLGVSYTVLDYDNGRVREITVVDSDDLYRVTSGMRGREHVAGVVQQHCPRLRGMVRDPTRVAWYAASAEEYQLERAIMLARDLDTDVVVVELLPD